jgi:hypothetical protein
VFDVILLSIAGVLQLVVLWYTMDIAVRRHRIRNAIVIGFVGLDAVGLTAWAAYDAYISQERLNIEIASIKKQLSGAKVGLVALGLQPPVQELIPQKDIRTYMAIGVWEGTAHNMRCNFGAYTLPGPQSTTQNRIAILKFREDIAKNAPGTGEDRTVGLGCFFNSTFRLSEPEIQEVVKANRTIYLMGHAEWQNESGANFHTDVCKWMEPTKDRVLSNPAWHDCTR